MNILLMDPCAWLMAGHHFQFDLALATEFDRLGHSTGLLCHRDAAPSVLSAEGVFGHFTAFPGKSLSDDPLVGDLETYLQQNADFLRDLRALGNPADFDDTLLVFPNMFHHMLFGLAEWLEAAGQERIPDLAIVLPGLSGFDDAAGSVSWQYALYRHGFNALRRVAKDAPRLFALTADQAAEYTTLAGRSVRLAPYPTAASAWPDLEPPRPRPSTGRRRVAFLGGSGGRKGFGMLPEIVAGVTQARPGTEFVIQFQQDGVNPLPADTVAELRRMNEKVVILDGYLDPGSFYRAILESDILLLPYGSPMYRSGSSALFEEALYLGRPVVVPPATTLAAGLAELADAGRVADSRDGKAFAAAIIAVIDDYPRYSSGAVAGALRRRGSSGMNRFARSILSEAD